VKLISYEYRGAPSFGVLLDSGIVDLRLAFRERITDLRSLLAANALNEAARLAREHPIAHQMDDVTLLPPIPNPGKIWCCGLNYHEHVEETQRNVTEQPTFFLRTPDSQVGHQQPLVRPRVSTHFDFEGELAIVIGRPGRHIKEEEAAHHVAAYSCYNDGSIRDWQRHTTQWSAGKNFWHSGSFGPWLVTADEIPFGATMTVRTRLNGHEMQRATTDMMIHSIARQISYLSHIAPLEPGDVIVTGTPGGIGARRNPPIWMKAGDIVDIEVDRVGVLQNAIVDEA
jgi:2-keto-4-pentenoate hydratase/2-oxohepta-3-ene-1,7-dioic acid hydratase in catechol pathway